MDIFGNFDNSKESKVSKFNYQEYQHQDATLAGMSDLPAEKANHNFGIYYFSFLAVMLVLVFRLFNIQVVESSYNQKLAKGNSIRPRIIAASRGLITDSKGVQLAKNVPSFALTMIPADLPVSAESRTQIFQTLAGLTGVSVDDMNKMYDKDRGQNKQNLSLDPITIKQNITREDSLILEQRVADFPGISVDKTALRQYSAIPSFGNILGYIGAVSDQDLTNNPDLRPNDQIGKDGLESVYDSYLRGKPGIENIEVDSTGRVARVLSDKDNIDPVAGGNLVLNIDSVLQQKIVGYLMDGINQAKLTDPGVDSAAAVVMDPKTGAILSLVTVPSYDDNLFSGGISNADYKKLLTDPSKPLFNRATNGTYPSGSIIKPMEASAALQAGTITANTTMVTPAAITIGQYVFPDWKDHSYETTDVKRALAESNNVFFYSVGGGYGNIQGLGVDRLHQYFTEFGLGSKTGIDLPSEAAGLVPTPPWKKKTQGTDWYIGDTYHEAIGQGDLLVTPLQMVTAISAIANGGTLYTPQIAKEVVDNSGSVIKSFAPKVQRSGFISASNLQVVQAGMRMGVTQGSSRQLNTLPFTSAGKTGTAQFLDNTKTHAWFECYAPYENPQVSVVVLIEGGGAGNAVAVPVAENILKAFFGLQ
jgi:penicillin-binding protein 2